MVTRPTVFLRLRVWRRLTCVAFGLVCVAAPVCAQRASLQGQVIDQNGAVVVGAKVSARASGVWKKWLKVSSPLMLIRLPSTPGLIRSYA